MRFLVGLVLLSTTLCFGQVPKFALRTASSDIYVGYIATSPDYGPSMFSIRLDGGEVAYTKSYTAHWGLTASGISNFGYVSVKGFSGTVGPKYNFLTGNFRPYATAQAGYAYQSSAGMYATDHHPPLPKGANDVESGFTYRFGAGADLQLSKGWYWRPLQWDIQPQPWARHTPWYVNLSSGMGYQF